MLLILMLKNLFVFELTISVRIYTYIFDTYILPIKAFHNSNLIAHHPNKRLTCPNRPLQLSICHLPLASRYSSLIRLSYIVLLCCVLLS